MSVNHDFKNGVGDSSAPREASLMERPLLSTVLLFPRDSASVN